MNKDTIVLNGETLLSKAYVMQKFGISNVTLCKWVKKGIIRQHNLGKQVYFIEKELFEDIKNSGPAIRKSRKEKAV